MSAKRCSTPKPCASEPVCAEALDGDAVDADSELVRNPAVAAALPPELLQNGEIVVLLLKPSGWYILLGPLASLVAIVVVTLLLMQIDIRLDLGIRQRDLAFLGTAAIAARLSWQVLDWLSRVYVLTDRRVIRVKGVLRVQVFECGLAKVQHTYTLFTLRERLFGLGTIGFATAGTATIEAAWIMVSCPLEVHQRVVQTLNRYR